jgi:hypothetical protein
MKLGRGACLIPIGPPRPRIDLSGQAFGRLLVLECLGPSVHGNTLWRCRCTCDGERVVAGNDLKRKKGGVVSCGACPSSMQGNAVACPPPVRPASKVCQACGIEKPVSGFHLLRRGGNQTQALCKPCAIARRKSYLPPPRPRAVRPPKAPPKRRWRDLAGQRFGRLTAIRMVGRDARRHGVLWECACDCGAIKAVTSVHLTFRPGRGTRSCGCLELERRLRSKVGEYVGGNERVFRSVQAWARAVRASRPARCEMCGWDRAKCDVHHRIPMSNGGLSVVSNGLVLCPNCHREQHEQLRLTNSPDRSPIPTVAPPTQQSGVAPITRGEA